MRPTKATFLTTTVVRRLTAGKLSQYEQEAFESHCRFVESDTYPGPIREATPGDTRFYMGSAETILHRNERHYWRAVIDDPQVDQVFPLRIRFKTNVWVTSAWEQRMQVVQVMVSQNATIEEVIDKVKIENQSPYLAELPFTLSMKGKELDKTNSVSFYGINEQSEVDAIDSADFSFIKEYRRPKDWNVDELSPEDISRSPIKEMEFQPLPQLAPRYEGKPNSYLGMNNYGGMKQR